jgi:hypothetical protein
MIRIAPATGSSWLASMNPLATAIPPIVVSRWRARRPAAIFQSILAPDDATRGVAAFVLVGV